MGRAQLGLHRKEHGEQGGAGLPCWAQAREQTHQPGKGGLACGRVRRELCSLKAKLEKQQ